MTLEFKPEQFNKEKFKKDIDKALKDYLESVENLESFYNGVGWQAEEKNRLQLIVEQGMKQIIKLVIIALQLSNEKQEILNLISKSIKESNLEKTSSALYYENIPESLLWKDIIIELLKKKSE